jgi:membrane protein involved in colicin uptake
MPTQTVAELQAAADKAQRDLKAAQDAAAAEAKVKAEPRTPEVVLGDLLGELVMLNGNRKPLQLLLTEFKAATKQEAPADAPTS